MMNFKGPRGHKFAESPVLKLRLPAWRSRLMALLILSCFGVLIGRSFYLQVLNNDFLQEKDDSRYRRDLEISASRGRIADRNGDVLAISTPMKSVWAIPADARLNSEQTKQLAGLLETDVKELSRKLASDKSFIFLKRQLPPDVGDQVAALKLPGIGQDKEYRRYYPNGEMTAHIVGFTGVDDKGLEGVELAYQSQLLGLLNTETSVGGNRPNRLHRRRHCQHVAVTVGNAAARRGNLEVAPVTRLALLLQEIVIEHLQIERTADQHAKTREDQERHQARAPGRQAQLEHRTLGKLVPARPLEAHHRATSRLLADAVIILADSGMRTPRVLPAGSA